MNKILTILAQAETTAAPAAPEVADAAAGGSIMGNPLVIMVLFMAAMYFLMIAPQRKKQKQHQQMMSNLETGDDVITIGGLYGKITNKDEKTFTIKVDDGTKIKILKSAVGQKVESESSTETK
jgi:preprotein translocase, YajC subunit